jgi:G:T-mismatch repair DNA endonuclease (very short patch repair protein)
LPDSKEIQYHSQSSDSSEDGRDSSVPHSEPQAGAEERLAEVNRTQRKKGGFFLPGNKYGALAKGIPKSEDWKRKASLAKMGERNPMKNPVYAKRMADSKRGRPNPKHKEFWRLHKEEQLRKMMVGEHKKPNKLELRLIDLINRNGLQFRYVGNWELLVGGKCPDFISTNDRKQLIELFGDYWHTVKARETAKERAAHFKRFGYETLILWEHDLQDEDRILQKIRVFGNGN